MVIIAVLIVVIFFALLFSIMLLVKNAKAKQNASGKMSGNVQKKGKSAVIKEAEKRLAKDPKDIPALQTLAKLYYEAEEWAKAGSIYKTLFDLSGVHPEIDFIETAKKGGISYYKTGNVESAQPLFILAGKKAPDDFDINYYMGRILFDKGVYDKAAAAFKKCKILNQDNLEMAEHIAMALFKAGKFRDSLPFFKQALDYKPGNKEILYNMAVAMSDSGMGDKALKLFIHLRPDPVYGPQSCFEAGKLHERIKNLPAAIQDYEIGMKLSSVPDQLMLQIRYRCGNAYIQLNNIQKALECFNKILDIAPNYKDVESLVSRYSELNQNKNLKTYLMAGTSEFVALCRKLVTGSHPNSIVKIEDTIVNSDNVEITCTVQNTKVEMKEIFRFYRNQAAIGDFHIREFHSKMRDAKCDSGYCITMGEFSDGAHKFAEGRPLDLIEKTALNKMLKKVSMYN